jgi:hypothetical protein
MTRVSAVLVVVALAMGDVAFGAFSATEVFVPSVARAPGTASSQWYTCLWVYNPGSAPVNVQFYFLERNKPNPSLTVAGGDTMRIENAVETLFGLANHNGAIRVKANERVIVNARTYSKPSGGEEKDTVGQFFAAVPIGFAIGAGQRTQVLGVYQTSPQVDSQYRYNFGFVEVSGQSATVRVIARDTTGAEVGSGQYTIGGYEPRQYNIAALLPGVDSPNLRLELEVIAGSGKIVAFGSGLANRSNDPSTFEMSFRDELLGGGSGSGLTTVAHDGTLSGDGTTGSPLGISNGGVTAAKLSATGSSNGQVLTSDGSKVAWKSGELTLPYSGSGSSAGALVAVTNSGTGIGLDGKTTGLTGIGVRGTASSTANTINRGGYFEAYGVNGRAVEGAVNGANGWAVYGLALGQWGRGVFGEARQGGAVGVQGQSTTGDGVVGTSDAATKSGVYGVNSKPEGYGVFGRNQSLGNTGYLGGSYGVYGSSAKTHGGYFETAGGLAAGVYGKSTGSVSYGGVFEATGNYAYGLLAIGPTGDKNGAAAIFRGNVLVQARATATTVVELGEGLDYAEGFDVTAEAGAGAVLVIDPEQPGKLALAREAYDRRVAGIVAGARELGSGVRLGSGQFSHTVALAGRVYCNVDTSYGAIEPGDLLTTSPTPGHAMVASSAQKATGAVLGKAMEGLVKGRKGQILVLVTLQ